MTVGIDADRNILFPEYPQEAPVGIKIPDRPVPAICIYFKCHIVQAEAFCKASVIGLRIGRRYETVYPYQIAVGDYIEQTGGSRCHYIFKIILPENVDVFSII